MSYERLRLAAFCVYLAAWLAAAIWAVVSGLPRIGKQADSPSRIRAGEVIGTVLQAVSVMGLTYTMRSGPLRPSVLELTGVLLLAPVAAVFLVWVVVSRPRNAGAETLVTSGAYGRLRHPIYFAFLLLLVATGLVLSSGLVLVVAAACYAVGTELRIASEEKYLAGQFRAHYEEYCRRTQWRYLPWLR